MHPSKELAAVCASRAMGQAAAAAALAHVGSGFGCELMPPPAARLNPDKGAASITVRGSVGSSMQLSTELAPQVHHCR
jgi:hypothetical protein